LRLRASFLAYCCGSHPAADIHFGWPLRYASAGGVASHHPHVRLWRSRASRSPASLSSSGQQGATDRASELIWRSRDVDTPQAAHAAHVRVASFRLEHRSGLLSAAPTPLSSTARPSCWGARPAHSVWQLRLWLNGRGHHDDLIIYASAIGCRGWWQLALSVVVLASWVARFW
jgi:hypothetical protein